MFLRRLLLGGASLAILAAVTAHAEEPKPISPDQFDKLHKMIRPQAGELRFQEIPWLLNVHEARKKAAAEGKPILIWSGSGGAPLGVC
jgi:hypothetical protein